MPSGPIVVAVFLALAAVGIVYYIIAARKRREALRAVAVSRGLAFYSRDPYNLPVRYEAMKLCGQGHGRAASNVIAGPVGDGEVNYFDYSYTVGSGKDSHTYSLSACAFRVPCMFKRLLVRPENLFDKAAALIGFEDIDLDLDEFNRKFYVSSEDKKFAYDVLNQRAMEFLLDLPGITMEMGWNYCLFNYRRVLKPDEVNELISAASQFYDLLPDFLKADGRLVPPGERKATGSSGQSASGGVRFSSGIAPTVRRDRKESAP